MTFKNLSKITNAGLITVMLFSLIAYDNNGIITYLFNVTPQPGNASDRTITDWAYFIGMDLAWVLISGLINLIAINIFSTYIWTKRIAATFLIIAWVPVASDFIYEDQTVSHISSNAILAIAIIFPFILYRREAGI
jgi:hypothetical protein